MPFGASVVVTDGGESRDPTELVNFVRAHKELIEPALNSAGCDAFRGDKEVSAGDIRTEIGSAFRDMKSAIRKSRALRQ